MFIVYECGKEKKSINTFVEHLSVLAVVLAVVLVAVVIAKAANYYFATVRCRKRKDDATSFRFSVVNWKQLDESKVWLGLLIWLEGKKRWVVVVVVVGGAGPTWIFVYFSIRFNRYCNGWQVFYGRFSVLISESFVQQQTTGHNWALKWLANRNIYNSSFKLFPHPIRRTCLRAIMRYVLADYVQSTVGSI